MLIDCPPALGADVAAALVHATAILVPTPPEALSLDAIQRILQTIDAAKRTTRRRGRGFTWRVLVTMLDATNPDSYLIESHLRAELGNRVLPGAVKRHPAFASAALERKSVFETAPTIRPAGVYRQVARDLLRGWQKLEGDAP